MSTAAERALKRGGGHLLARLGHVLGRLGLQTAAVLYFIFALAFGAAGIKGWIAGRHAALVPSALISLTQARPLTQLELGLALVFFYFGFTSWTRAGRHS